MHYTAEGIYETIYAFFGKKKGYKTGSVSPVSIFAQILTLWLGFVAKTDKPSIAGHW
jgi:hypothetical protein